MEKDFMNNNALVCKHNNLINATYKLNLSEQKIVLVISSMINPNDEEFKEYSLSVEKFANIMGIDLSKNTGLYTRLKRKSALLLSKRLTIHEPDGDLQTTWFASIKYFDKEGKMSFCFAPRLKKYYLQLQQYTKYRLKNISNLKSQYSIRIYELLKQYQRIGTREFKNLNDFKTSIGLSSSQYPRFYDLKNRAILVAQKELKEQSDICFDFQPIKKGRKVIGIRFIIHKNKTAAHEAAVTLEDTEANEMAYKIKKDIEAVQKIFSKHPITKEEALDVLKDAKGDMDLIKMCYQYSLTKNLDNIVGYMRILVRNFNSPKENIKKDSFNDYEQRDYDYSSLEKKLLGWDKQ